MNDVLNQKLREINDGSNLILDEIPSISYIGDPVLRQRAQEVTLEEGLVIGKKLITLLQKYRDLTGVGVGLAAPQIGEGKRVFVIFSDGNFKIYINPVLKEFSQQENLYKENCLSSRHVWCDVTRPIWVKLSYTNEQGQRVENELHEDFSARLIQHEYDHLDGLVNLDRAVPGTIDYRFGNPREEKLRDIKINEND